jgi:hypothetical protein
MLLLPFGVAGWPDPSPIGLVMPLVWRLTKYRCYGYVSNNLTCGVWLDLQTVCRAMTLLSSTGLVILLRFINKMLSSRMLLSPFDRWCYPLQSGLSCRWCGD